MEIADIIEAIQANRIRISDHADEEAEFGQLTFDEVYFSVVHGEFFGAVRLDIGFIVRELGSLRFCHSCEACPRPDRGA